MVPTFQDSPSKQFSRENPAWGWGWPCCCGTAIAANVLVAVGFQRIAIPDSGIPGTATIGNEQTIAAFDGATGAVLWYYDLGFRFANRPYVPGRILVDSSGNVYVTSIEALGGNQVNILNKFNKSGVLQWQYDPGPSTAGGANRVNGICFDSAGNIIFGIHNSDAVNFNYALKISPAGALLFSYSTHGTGFPGGFADGALTTGTGIGLTGAPGSIAVDASDNLYWVAPVNRTQLVSVTSTGAFRYVYQPVNSVGVVGTSTTTLFLSDLMCDKTNSKLYIQRAASVLVSDGSTQYSDLTPVLTKLDISGAGTASPTVDWDFIIDGFVGGSGSLNLNRNQTNLNGLDVGNSMLNGGMGLDLNVFRCYFPGGVLADNGSPANAIENWASCQSGATPTVGFLSAESTLVSDRNFGLAQCCDPTSGMVFAIPERIRPTVGSDAVLNSGLKRLDPASGIPIWSALQISAMQPMSVGAGSYT